MYEYAGNHLLVINGLSLEPIGQHVIDVLDKDDVGIDLGQGLNQCAVTSGAEQQRAVFITEWSVVGIGGNGVG